MGFPGGGNSSAMLGTPGSPGKQGFSTMQHQVLSGRMFWCPDYLIVYSQLSGTSINTTGQSSTNNQGIGVSHKYACANKSCYYGDRRVYLLRTCPKLHCCLSIKWVDRDMVYPFAYSAYSGLPLEPRCPNNRGSTVLIIIIVDWFDSQP